MATKIERRERCLRELATQFACIMEQNETMGKLIEDAGTGEDDETAEIAVSAVQEFQLSVAHMIGALAIIVTDIDNSSAAMFLGQVAGQMVNHEMEHDPLVLLRGLLGGSNMPPKARAKGKRITAEPAGISVSYKPCPTCVKLREDERAVLINPADKQCRMCYGITWQRKDRPKRLKIQKRNRALALARKTKVKAKAKGKVRA